MYKYYYHIFKREKPLMSERLFPVARKTKFHSQNCCLKKETSEINSVIIPHYLIEDTGV